MSSLAVKYRPKTFEDVTEQSVVTDILESICENNSNDMSCRNFLLTGPAGCGKAQPLTSKVLTPDGYIEMKDVKVGTEVFTEVGDIAKVTDIYPQGEKDVYRIHMVNGDFIDVSDEHLNVVYSYDEEHDAYYRYVIETNRLKESLDDDQLKLLNIPIPEVEFEHKDLKISPYVLGVLFANPANPEVLLGQLLTNRLSIRTENFNLNFYLEEYENDDFKRIDLYICNDYRTITYLLSNEYIQNLKEIYQVGSVEELVYAFRKVPDIIKYNDKDTRYQFLEGMYACCNAARDVATGVIQSNCIIEDIEGFKFVCESLGHLCYASDMTQQVHMIAKHENQSHHFYDIMNTYFIYGLGSKFDRNISNIEYVGKQECQCLMIDDETHTYISDNMVPTHNTTCARIMSNMLNDGVGEPIEIDAASHGNVEEVRDLVKQAQQYPVGQKYKIFIVDEAHSISNTAWQVFLKTLESSPARTIWIFCTTNPEKIPETILSRVQTFQLSKISLKGIDDRLLYVINEENKEGRGITYTNDAVNYIAKLANGGMRESLTLLDKVLAYDNDLTIDNVSKALSLPEYDDYFALLSAYAKKDDESIIRIVDKVYNSGVNFVKWFEDFHSFVINIVKYIFLKDINMTMIPSTYQDRISEYNEKHVVICLKLANKLVKMNQELKSTQYLQELALTYLCFVPTSKRSK